MFIRVFFLFWSRKSHPEFFCIIIEIPCIFSRITSFTQHQLLLSEFDYKFFSRYADNGDLLDFIKRNGVVPEQQAKIWFRQMASGLHYLHGKNIAHRDLKCENILLSRKFNVKLADFGFARFCVDTDNRRILSQTYCGSAAYAAPEVVNGTPYNPKLSDVWSLGIILFIMLNASMPFDDSNLRKLLKDQMTKNWVFRSRVRETLSSSAKSLVRHLLEPDLTLRLTLDRVTQHEWLRIRKDRPSSLIGRLVHSAPHGQPAGQSGVVAGEYRADTESMPGDFKNPDIKKSEMMINVNENTPWENWGIEGIIIVDPTGLNENFNCDVFTKYK